MDWFFREYVYGTDLPAYHFESDFAPSGDGWKVHFKLVQSGVDAQFVNVVPLYMELTDGKIMRLGLILAHGPKTVEPEFSIAQARRAHQADHDQLLLRHVVHG